MSKKRPILYTSLVIIILLVAAAFLYFMRGCDSKAVVPPPVNKVEETTVAEPDPIPEPALPTEPELEAEDAAADAEIPSPEKKDQEKNSEEKQSITKEADRQNSEDAEKQSPPQKESKDVKETISSGSQALTKESVEVKTSTSGSSSTSPKAPPAPIIVVPNPEEIIKEKGALVYAIPDSMKVNHPELVEVRISRSLAKDKVKALTKRLSETAKVEKDTISTGEEMDVQLTEHDTTDRKFIIVPRQKTDQQIIAKDEVGYWAWSVTPKVAGQHSLLVEVAVKKRSEKSKTVGYTYIPVYEQKINIESVPDTLANLSIQGIPKSYDNSDDKTINRIFSEPIPEEKEAEEIPKASLPWLLILSIIGTIGLLSVLYFSRKKKALFTKPPPIPNNKLEEIDELIKKDKLEAALDSLEALVIKVRDKEHNELLSYHADLDAFHRKYKAGEIKFEEYARVRARIRRALIEMNDRLMES